jgi:hypothetical protein
LAEKKRQRQDYDNLFKNVLRDYFWDGLKIFLPELYEAADREYPVELLDKELQKVTFDLEGGANRIDMLAKIKLKNGESEFVLCHLEIQGNDSEVNLPRKMYRYKEAIDLLYDKEPVGIAVITAGRPKNESVFYHSDTFGVKVTYEYKNFNVIYIDDEILLAEENRIGLVLYAAKCAFISGKDETKKFQYLRHISDLWNERGWSPHDKRMILEAVNYLIRLSDEGYKRQIVEYVENLRMKQEDKEMYVSVFEEVYKEKGRAEGRAKGRAEGRKEGRAEGREEGRKEGWEEAAKEIAKNFLANGTSPDIIAANTGLSLEKIRSLMN